MNNKERINTLEQYIISKYGKNKLDEIYMNYRINKTNRILEIADADEFERARMETAVYEED